MKNKCFNFFNKFDIFFSCSYIGFGFFKRYVGIIFMRVSQMKNVILKSQIDKIAF